MYGLSKTISNTNMQMHQQTPRLSLLGLPCEVRMMIVQLALGALRQTAKPVKLLETCTQIRREGRQILFGQNCITLWGHQRPGFLSWLTGLGEDTMFIRHIMLNVSAGAKSCIYETFFPNCTCKFNEGFEWPLSVTMSGPDDSIRESANILTRYGMMQRYSSEKYGVPHSHFQLHFQPGRQQFDQIDFHRLVLSQDSDLGDVLHIFLRSVKVDDEECQDVIQLMQHFLQRVRPFDQGRRVFIRLFHPAAWYSALETDYLFRVNKSLTVEEMAHTRHASWLRNSS